MSRSLYLPNWGLVSTLSRVDLDLLLERVSKEPLRYDSQIVDHERRAMKMDALRYLPTRQAMTIKRFSQSNSTNNSTHEKVGLRNQR